MAVSKLYRKKPEERERPTYLRGQREKLREQIICQERVTKIKGGKWGYKKARREENKLMMS